MNDLEMYRESLALCDDKIIDALVERSKIVEKIMAYKEEYGMPILQPQQEAKQALRLEEKLNDNKYREEIMDIFECIRMNSKKIQARKLFDYNIVMIGFMGAGKSTVAEYLSTMFAMEVVEMDQEIVKEEGMSIPDIFATYGEEYFRNKCNNSGSFKAEDNRTPEENAEPQKCTHFLRRRSCTSRMQCRTDEEEWKSRSSDCQSGGSL